MDAVIICVLIFGVCIIAQLLAPDKPKTREPFVNTDSPLFFEFDQTEAEKRELKELQEERLKKIGMREDF